MDIEAFERHFALYSAFIAGGLAQHGLTLSIRHDLDVWADEVRRSELMAHVNPILDPGQSYVDETNAYWLAVTDRDGGIAAAHAGRLFIEEDLHDLIASNRIWYQRGKVPPEPVNLVLPEEARRIRGRVAYTGGMFVRPEYRRLGIGRNLSDYSHLCVVGVLDADWQVSFAKRHNFQAGIDKPNYLSGYRIFPCIEGWYPPMRENCTMDLGYLDRDDLYEIAARSAMRGFVAHFDTNDHARATAG